MINLCKNNFILYSAPASPLIDMLCWRDMPRLNAVAATLFLSGLHFAVASRNLNVVLPKPFKENCVLDPNHGYTGCSDGNKYVYEIAGGKAIVRR